MQNVCNFASSSGKWLALGCRSGEYELFRPFEKGIRTKPRRCNKSRLYSGLLTAALFNKSRTVAKMLNTHRHKHFGPGTRDGTHAHVAHAIKGVDTNTFAVVLGHPPLHPQGGLLHRRRKIWRDVTAWHGSSSRQRRRRLKASRAPPLKSERQT